MKRLLSILFCMLVGGICHSQETVYGTELAEPYGDVDMGVYSIDFRETVTHVGIAYKPRKDIMDFPLFQSQNTYIVGSDGTKLPIIGLTDSKISGTVEDCFFDGSQRESVHKGQWYRFFLLFSGRLPAGVTEWNLVDEGNKQGRKGFSAYHMFANNPMGHTPIWTKERCQKNIDGNNDGICGIYEAINDDRQQQFAVIKDDGEYKMIYIGAKTLPYSWWIEGDTKAELRSTSVLGVFKADWIKTDKFKIPNCYIAFDGVSMSASAKGKTLSFIKMYPAAIPEEKEERMTAWEGTGFALNNGYIVTNHHVAANAKTVIVQGVKGSFSINYNAEVVAMDEASDLAILKIRDSRFAGFGAIPYKIKTELADVGEDVFVLGYPMTQTMGNEVKLTTGIVSARTGFQNESYAYQITAPIQPGNSGGPLFDKRGNVIGIVNSRLTGAQNVNYAIKASCLRRLVENSSLPLSILPQNNVISAKPLAGKVKEVRNFVFHIICSTE